MLNWIISGVYLCGCTIMDIKKKELNLIYCTIFFIVGIAYALLYLNGNMEGLIFALMPGIVPVSYTHLRAHETS